MPAFNRLGDDLKPRGAGRAEDQYFHQKSRPRGGVFCDDQLIGDDQTRSRARRSGTFTRLVCSQRLEGSRFGMLRGDLAIFASALHPTKECCSRRLPGITQRDAFTCGFQFVHNRAIELRKRWVVPGSRLFSHVSARLVMRRRLRGWRDTRQSGSPPGVASKQDSSTCQPLSRTRTTTRTITIFAAPEGVPICPGW